MRKILVSLLVSGFCCLTAAWGEGVPNLLGSELYKIRKVSGRPAIEYPVGGDDLFDVKYAATWYREEGSSREVAVESFDTEGTELYISKNERIFPHVSSKPDSAEERANCLWKVETLETRVQQNHRFVGNEPASLILGGLRLSQGVIKGDTYRIYVNTYAINIVRYEGEKPGSTFIASVRPVGITHGNVLKKKSGSDLFNSDNYSGQGSHGEEPRTEADIIQKFKSLFPEYSSYL